MGIALWVTVGIAILALAGFVYQGVAEWLDRHRYTRVGRHVTLADGCRLYLREEGSGKPTVIFEAGIGASSLNWAPVQAAIARETATLAYDRAGLGWSDPCRTERTPSNVAAELNEMLQRAKVKPPFVLVGHSFGGLVVRRYALLYPENVAGLVLLDPMRCDEWPPFVPERTRQLAIAKGLCRSAIPCARCGLSRIGLSSLFLGSGRVAERLARIAGKNCEHVLRRVRSEVTKMPAEARPVIVALWSKPSFYRGMWAYLDGIPATAREMADAPSIRGIPVTVLTPGLATPLNTKALERIGDRVRQVIAAKSEHWIHLDEPELVIDAIREMVSEASDACRAGSASGKLNEDCTAALEKPAPGTPCGA